MNETVDKCAAPAEASNDNLIAWCNFTTLFLSSIIFSVLYVKSVQPSRLEKLIGAEAYERCKWYRIVACAFMMIAGCNCLVFGWYPVPGLPAWLVTFPWSYETSIRLAVVITIPFSYLMCVGMYDAGEETMTPKKEHSLYSGGIYDYMRHPQAVGEFPLWYTFAFLAHSPFLTLLSCVVYLPIWYLFSIEEEKDLKLRYGEPYEEYCERVGWFPRISDLRSHF